MKILNFACYLVCCLFISFTTTAQKPSFKSMVQKFPEITSELTNTDLRVLVKESDTLSSKEHLAYINSYYVTYNTTIPIGKIKTGRGYILFFGEVDHEVEEDPAKKIVNIGARSFNKKGKLLNRSNYLIVSGEYGKQKQMGGIRVKGKEVFLTYKTIKNGKTVEERNSVYIIRGGKMLFDRRF